MSLETGVSQAGRDKMACHDKEEKENPMPMRDMS